MVPSSTRRIVDDEELTNTDLESNKVIYSQHMIEGMSPIKVEDESEEIIVTGGRSHRRSQIRQGGGPGGSRRDSNNN
jgi:hypothetical protein